MVDGIKTKQPYPFLSKQQLTISTFPERRFDRTLDIRTTGPRYLVRRRSVALRPPASSLYRGEKNTPNLWGPGPLLTPLTKQGRRKREKIAFISSYPEHLVNNLSPKHFLESRLQQTILRD